MMLRFDEDKLDFVKYDHVRKCLYDLEHLVKDLANRLKNMTVSSKIATGHPLHINFVKRSASVYLPIVSGMDYLFVYDVGISHYRNYGSGKIKHVRSLVFFPIRHFYHSYLYISSILPQRELSNICSVPYFLFCILPVSHLVEGVHALYDEARPLAEILQLLVEEARSRTEELSQRAREIYNMLQRLRRRKLISVGEYNILLDRFINLLYEYMSMYRDLQRLLDMIL